MADPTETEKQKARELAKLFGYGCSMECGASYSGEEDDAAVERIAQVLAEQREAERNNFREYVNLRNTRDECLREGIPCSDMARKLGEIENELLEGSGNE